MKSILKSSQKSLLIVTVLMLGLSIETTDSAGNPMINKTYKSNYSISEIPETLFNRKLKQHAASFAISPDKVLFNLKQNRTTILIDVRDPNDFARLHLPGSLNIPLHAVKTKSFLRSFPIVLINEGFNYSPLESECRQLKNLGFNIIILDGGLIAWQRKGNRIVGELFTLQEMRVVTPQVFFQEKDYENTLVIDISPVQSKISRQLIPFAMHLPINDEPKKWVRKVNQIITSRRGQPFLTILVLNETGDGYDRVDQILVGLDVNAFFLKGGAVGYKSYLDDLMLAWLPRDNRIKTNRRCGTCAQEIEK